jgi:hypothetical protein
MKAVIPSAEASAPELRFAESSWNLRHEVGRPGFAFHHPPWRGQATLLGERLSLEAKTHLSAFPWISRTEEERGCYRSAQEADKQPDCSNSLGYSRFQYLQPFDAHCY